MTGTDIQKHIDHYGAVRDAYKELFDASDGDMGYFGSMAFYDGKQDAYIDLYKEIFDTTERAYPFNQEEHDATVAYIKKYELFQHKSKPVASNGHS